MALGATPWAMIALVLRDVAVMVVAGLVVGGGGALLLTGLAGKILFGVTPNDPAAFAAAGGILAGASLIAGWLPARGAAQVDPLIALGHE